MLENEVSQAPFPEPFVQPGGARTSLDRTDHNGFFVYASRGQSEAQIVEPQVDHDDVASLMLLLRPLVRVLLLLLVFVLLLRLRVFVGPLLLNLRLLLLMLPLLLVVRRCRVNVLAVMKVNVMEIIVVGSSGRRWAVVAMEVALVVEATARATWVWRIWLAPALQDHVNSNPMPWSFPWS